MGNKVAANSITSISLPKRLNTEPNSKPITPAPITNIFLGISFMFNASVEVIIRFLSGSIPGKKLGFDPVAMMMFFAVITVSEPSSLFTETEFLSTKEPKP